MISRNILFTGPPGCGKTTLLDKIVQTIKRPANGFITSEIRKKGRRVGFFIKTLDGKKCLLAHRDIKSRYRVGKYGVSLENIDRIAVPSMIPKLPDAIVVVDEIGKMECFSSMFRKTLIKVLDSDHTVIGSISLKGSPFISQIKTRKDILLIHLTEQNRNTLVDIYADL
jgi:nucleoside-triphosphatase